MHIQSVKVDGGNRFYYDRSMYDIEPVKNGKYTVYPAQKKITIIDEPSIGCLKINE